MRKEKLYPLLVIVALVGASFACGGSNTGEKVGEQGQSATSPPPTLAVYRVGEVIQVEDHTIVLNSAEFQDNVLKANFTIENNGSEDLNVSSMLSFSAKDTEGTQLEQEIFDCGSSLDGKVLPGDKLKGDICWKGAATESIKIYYEASLFDSGAVVWQVSK